MKKCNESKVKFCRDCFFYLKPDIELEIESKCLEGEVHHLDVVSGFWSAKYIANKVDDITTKRNNPYVCGLQARLFFNPDYGPKNVDILLKDAYTKFAAEGIINFTLNAKLYESMYGPLHKPKT